MNPLLLIEWSIALICAAVAVFTVLAIVAAVIVGFRVYEDL